MSLLAFFANTTTTTTVLWPFFRDHPLLDFMVQRNINRGRHTDHPDGRHSIRTSNQCPPPPSPHIFYRPDALPAAQPTTSKHRRQLAHSDQGEDARVLLNGVTCTISILCKYLHWYSAKELQQRIQLNSADSLLSTKYCCHWLCKQQYKSFIKVITQTRTQKDSKELEMWANAQPDSRPAEHRWRPLFNAAKFGSHSI